MLITSLTESPVQQGPVPASTAINRGALMWLDFDNEVLKPASAMADQGTEALNQTYFAERFAGVSLDQRLAVQTTVGEIAIVPYAILQVDAESADYDFGDLVAVAEAASGTALEDLKVKKTSDLSSAIGIVVRNTGASTTKVWVLFQSRVFNIADRYARGFFGARQSRRSNTETLAATKTLVVSDAQLQILDPGGAGRNVDLPAVAASAGLTFIIRNTADAAEVITVRNAGGTTICTPTQNETAFVFCDGTAWYGFVAAHN